MRKPKLHNLNKPVAVIIVLLIAALGTHLILGSHAATPYASLTADSGTLTSSAIKQTCPGASDGNCVVFSNTSGTPITLSSPPPEQTAQLAGNTYGLKFNEWNSTKSLTMTSDGGADFNIPSSSLSLATGGAPSGYFELIKGSSWGDNTVNGGAPFPYLVSNIKAGTVTTTATCHTTGVTGDWDNSYDIWFNASPSAGQTNNQAVPYLEMMVWLNHTAGADPIGHVVRSNVLLGGNTYNVWYNGPEGSATNTVSYVLANPSTTISTDLYPLVQDAISSGYMPSSWYLLDVEFGFEIWNGGAGLGCTNFVVNAS